MEVDENNSNVSELNEIIDCLVKNESIYFKNQSREETDLTTAEKFNIAKEIFNKSKLNFLMRFGKYLKQEHLDYFKTLSSDEEINMILSNLTRFHSDHKLKTKNRRYEALNKLIKENSYFSENEMMKRNPLLYEQLVGQYLTEGEKKERDMNIEKDTLVKILLEGIERDIAEETLNKQIEEEDDDENTNTDEKIEVDVDAESKEIDTSFKWGEFPSSSCPSSKSPNSKKTISKLNNPIKKKKSVLQKNHQFVTAEERRLLKEEFTSIMHQNFLNGKDDIDYSSIDNNDEYDNIEILEHDEEDKYFDSEEPDENAIENTEKVEESSEDELDIYMGALNQHPTVLKLSDELQKM